MLCPTPSRLSDRAFCTMGLTLAMAVALALGGCTGYQPPKAADRRALARPEMRMGAEALDDRLQQQVYTRHETASGGSNVGGAGCGCN